MVYNLLKIWWRKNAQFAKYAYVLIITKGTANCNQLFCYGYYKI